MDEKSQNKARLACYNMMLKPIEYPWVCITSVTPRKIFSNVNYWTLLD